MTRGAFFLFISTLVSAGLGYTYWFIISKIGGPEIVGFASTTISLATIVLVIAHIGIPTGAQRFLGRAFGRKDMKSFKLYLEVELIIIGFSICLAALILILLRHELNLIIGLPEEFVLIAAAIIITRGLVSALKGVYIALLKTKELAIAEVSGSAFRLPLGAVLVILGFGGLGAASGFLIAYTVTLTIITIILINTIGWLRIPKLRMLKVKGEEIIRAGAANWPSAILILIGPQLGVIFVFGYKGAIEAGLFYIAQAMMFVIFAIPSSIMAMTFPLLSGMRDGRKRTIWRIIKICLVFSIPIIIVALLYSHIALALLGQEYIAGDTIFAILLISIVPSIIVLGVTNFVFAYGLYREVLSISLARFIPRIIFYIVLIPWFGGVGAAEATFIGSIVALILSCFIANKLKLKINWRDIMLTIIIPVLLSLPIYYFRVHWAIGSLIILSISFLSYAKMKLLVKNDLREISQAFLPQKIIDKGIRRFGWLLRILYEE